MKKRWLVVLGLTGVLLGGGGYALDRMMAASAVYFMAEMQKALPEGSRLRYGKMETSLFRREVSFDAFSYESNLGAFKAKRAVLQGVPWIGQGSVSLGSLSLQDARIEGFLASSVNELYLENPMVAQIPGKPDAAPVVTFKTLAVSGFALDTKGRGKMEVSSLVFDNLTNAGLDHMTLAGLKGALPFGERVPPALSSFIKDPALVAFSVDAAEVSGMQLSLFGSLSEGSGDVDLLNRLLFQDTLRRILVAGLSVDVISRSHGGDEARVSLVSLDHFEFDGRDVVDNKRQGLVVDGKNLQVNKGLLQSLPVLQAAVDGEMLKGEWGAKLRFDRSAKTAAVTESLVRVDGFGEVSFSGSVGNVQDVSKVTEGTAAMGVTFDGALLQLRADKGVNRLVAGLAAAQKVSPRAYVERLINDVFARLPVSDDASFIGELKAGCPDFFVGGGVMRIVANPSSPVPLLQLALAVFSGQIELLTQKMGLSVDVSPSE